MGLLRLAAQLGVAGHLRPREVAGEEPQPVEDGDVELLLHMREAEREGLEVLARREPARPRRPAGR